MKKRCFISRLSTGLFFNLFFVFPVFLTVALITATAGGVRAAVGEVKSHQKISDTEGNFTGILDNEDRLGEGHVASLGDVDGDGVVDIAVGSPRDDDGGPERGAVWILFLNIDGTVKAHQKISDTEGGFAGVLDNGDYFGTAVAGLGDHDGDGIGDLALGAVNDDDGGPDRGAVWILFLNIDGTVKAHQKISDTEGNFTGVIDGDGKFSNSLGSLGDLDGDGVGDLAVGARFDDDGGPGRGAVWILFLNIDGTVKAHQKISDTEGGFGGTLENNDMFGRSVEKIDDLDGDGIQDMVVGAYLDNDGGPDRGAVWILFLNVDGTVKAHQKISDIEGGFAGELNNNDAFGIGVGSLGDMDCDGSTDIAVGAVLDDDGGPDRGAVWILFLNCDGTVKAHQKISDTEGNFTGTLTYQNFFGYAVEGLDDLDGDGVGEVVVAACFDDDGGYHRGAVWVLFLEGDPCAQFALDIRPRSCPNPLNIKIFEDPPENAKAKKGGVLPVAVMADDVYEIDVTSLYLRGVEPLRHSYEDVTAPGQNGNACDCSSAGPDGTMDLTLKFATREIASAIGTAYDGEVIMLTLTGQLLDGTPFEVSDYVTILSKLPQPQMSAESNEVRLGPAVPNPFNPVTGIGYYVSKEQLVELSVYDVTGKLIDRLIAGVRPAGDHVVEWDASQHASGIYFYRLTAGNRTLTKKMVLLK